jgi:protease I
MVNDKKAVFIIPPIDFRDEELFETRAVLEKSEVAVKIASTVELQKKCIGMLKGVVVPDLRLLDVKAEDFDAFIYVGGEGASLLWNDSFALSLATAAYGLNKIVAAISNATVILANANIVQYRRVTGSRNEENKMMAKGAYCTGARVEYDRNIITAIGPDCAEQFGRSIFKGLQEY